MKNTNTISVMVLSLGLLLLSLPGCYTQLATIHDDESAYENEEDSNASAYEYDENSGWRSRSYLGFSYYYPTWSSSWAYDFCYHPSYWDSWWWYPATYPVFAHHSYHPWYWNAYRYPHYVSGGSYVYSNRYTTRNIGYVRGGNTVRDFGRTRTTSTGYSGSSQTGRPNIGRNDFNMPAPTVGSRGAAVTRNSSTRSSRSTEGTSQRFSIGRLFRGEYSPQVQQPRHRTEGNNSNERNSDRPSERRPQYRSPESTPSAPSRSREAAPSYSPPPSRSTDQQSAPSSRESSGGGDRGGSSGRSRR